MPRLPRFAHDPYRYCHGGGIQAGVTVVRNAKPAPGDRRRIVTRQIKRGGRPRAPSWGPIERNALANVREAAKEVSRGGLVVLVDDEREGEGDLAFAGRHSSPRIVNLCLQRGRGLLCLALWPADAKRIGVERLDTNNRDPFGTPFGTPIGIVDGSSGVSAASRSATIRAAADPTYETAHFAYPGHVPTLIAHDFGLFGRMGHTEGILELLRYAEVAGPGVVCEVLNEDGDTANPEELVTLGHALGTPLVSLRDLYQALLLGRGR